MKKIVLHAAIAISCACSVVAQDFELIFSYPTDGSAIYFDAYMDASVDRVDFDGDGNPDIFTRNGAVMEILGIDGPAHNAVVLWSYTLTEPFESFASEGASDVTPHPGKEVLLRWSNYEGERGVHVVSAAGDLIRSFPDRTLQDFADFDGDGYDELVLDADGIVAEVWDWNTNAVGVPGEIQRQGAMLAQNQPNPFNPQTKIGYQVQSAGNVRLGVLDMRGRHIRTLVNEFKGAGDHEVVWDGLDDHGRQQASGSYFYVLHVGEFSASRKLLLLK